MTTYIAILRGINVGGNRIIKMDTLKQVFSGLGFHNVQTYIQSGNVIFQDNISDNTNLEKKIGKAITNNFAFDVPVIVINSDELRQIISDNPFVSDKSKDASFLHVTFLDNIPGKELLEEITNRTFLPDEFIIINKAIYLYCPNGYSNPKLTNAYFENKLKVTATTRNWRTTLELEKIALNVLLL